MLSISTSYLDATNVDGTDILTRLDALDISGIELSYSLDRECFFNIRRSLDQSRLRVSSVPNFSPIPPSAPTGNSGGDVFLLSHPTADKRSKAVRWTKGSIEQARSVGAKVVVLHCGRIDMNVERERLYAFFRNGQIHSPQAQNFIYKKLSERKKEKSVYLDAVSAVWKNL